MYSSNTSTTSSQISCHYYFLPFGLTFRKVRHETQKWKSQFLSSTRTHAAMAACSSFSHENLYELFFMKISLHICKGHLSGLKSKKSDCCSMCEFRKEKKILRMTILSYLILYTMQNSPSIVWKYSFYNIHFTKVYESLTCKELVRKRPSFRSVSWRC